MPEIHDDKSSHVLPFILSNLRNPSSKKPLFIGLNGVQGAGKTVLVSQISQTLRSPPHNLPTIVFSLDDLYLTHADQVELAKNNPDNPLLQHRGQPGTHDVKRTLAVFEDLQQGRKCRIPKYNKAAFEGQGDRVDEKEWDEVNGNGEGTIKVVLFEGWCVGFQPLDDKVLERKWTKAVEEKGKGNYSGRLGWNSLASVKAINDSLELYTKLWKQFDLFVHIDAADPLYVYKWRLEQEATTKREKGSGMSDEAVNDFVNGYYPSYELYTETLRDGIFRPSEVSASDDHWKERQMRLVVGEDRKVKEVLKI